MTHDPELVRRLARVVCRVENVDPDAEGYGLGVQMPFGERYPLWQARIKMIEAILEEIDAKICK